MEVLGRSLVHIEGCIGLAVNVHFSYKTEKLIRNVIYICTIKGVGVMRRDDHLHRR
jgi:hypothetical protein